MDADGKEHILSFALEDTEVLQLGYEDLENLYEL